MAKNTNNGGLLGTGSHIEYLRQPSKANKAKRRRREQCPFYDKECNYCTKLRIDCVGYSNPMCLKHNK